MLCFVRVQLTDWVANYDFNIEHGTRNWGKKKKIHALKHKDFYELEQILQRTWLRNTQEEMEQVSSVTHSIIHSQSNWELVKSGS